MTHAPVTFAVCGFGSRGMEAYSAYSLQHPDEMKVTAVADPLPERRAAAAAIYRVPADRIFSSAEELLALPRLADVMIIATQDRQHVPQALAALEKGYDLLLEKPISPDLDECLALREKARRTGRAVVVCHVLRYTPFYSQLHQMLVDGLVGRVETIDAVEHVAYWHQAHSFVRGNWRRSDETSPMIMAKSCHDMDLLRWLADAPCKTISSYGSLDWFRPEHAPDGAAKRCLDGCAARAACPYDAEKIYLDNPKTGFRAGVRGWPVTVLCNGEASEEKIYDALRTGPYGRCVYHCDNNVVDHQVCCMEFENGVTATFTMTAFTQDNHRTIKVLGSLGEIEGDLAHNSLTVRPFGQPEYTVQCAQPGEGVEGHGGGDEGMMRAACALFAHRDSDALTSVEASVDSHLMALAAEHSRVHGGQAVELASFARKASSDMSASS